MTSYTGSNTERQSVGLPGHCDRCALVGHVEAHPDLGCGDVGCTGRHDEAAPERDLPDSFIDTGIPDTVLIWPALLPDGTPTVFCDAGLHAGVEHLTVHLWHAIRDGRLDQAPTGVLYTAHGAHRIDDVLAAMWNHPAVAALRRLPTGGARYGEQGMVVMERAQETLDALWSNARKGFAR